MGVEATERNRIDQRRYAHLDQGGDEVQLRSELALAGHRQRRRCFLDRQDRLEVSRMAAGQVPARTSWPAWRSAIERAARARQRSSSVLGHELFALLAHLLAPRFLLLRARLAAGRLAL